MSTSVLFMRAISAQRISAVSSSSVCGRTLQAETMISLHSSSLKKIGEQVGRGQRAGRFDFVVFMVVIESVASAAWRCPPVPHLLRFTTWPEYSRRSL